MLLLLLLPTSYPSAPPSDDTMGVPAPKMLLPLLLLQQCLMYPSN
jgi:hypothetical protein